MRGAFRQPWICGISVWLLCCAAVRADDAADERGKLVAEAFRKADRNNDGSLSADEFVGQRPQAQVLLRDFQMFDADQDEKLSLAEFDRDLNDWDTRPNEKVGLAAFVRTLSSKIPQEVLFTADADRDGKVSRAEARDFIEVQMGVRRNGVLLRLPNGLVNNHQYFMGMDRNQNEQLERAEFMPSVPAAQAEETFTQADKNRDGRVSLAEYKFERPIFSLLRVFFFRCYDLNHDGVLALDEYDFKTLKPGTLYSIRQEGNVLTKLSYGAKNVHCGSQCVSPDGKQLILTFHPD